MAAPEPTTPVYARPGWFNHALSARAAAIALGDFLERFAGAMRRQHEILAARVERAETIDGEIDRVTLSRREVELLMKQLDVAATRADLFGKVIAASFNRAGKKQAPALPTDDTGE